MKDICMALIEIMHAKSNLEKNDKIDDKTKSYYLSQLNKSKRRIISTIPKEYTV